MMMMDSGKKKTETQPRGNNCKSVNNSAGKEVEEALQLREEKEEEIEEEATDT